ncbi:hypothetical protein GTA07_14805 [Rhodococcus hoagii]|nr:hypothetical protein [Prescottella equi]
MTGRQFHAVDRRASLVLLGTQAWADQHGLPVLAYLVDGETAAVDFVDGREGLLMAPVYAVPRLLARNNLTLQDFDYYEIHEHLQPRCYAPSGPGRMISTAGIASGWMSAAGAIDRSRLNVKGSSLGAGHPFAATGGRILANVAQAAVDAPQGRGLISICARRRAGRYGHRRAVSVGVYPAG